MRVLIVTTDDAERHAVGSALHGPTQTRKQRHGDIVTVATAAGIVDVAAGGVGPVATASTAGFLLGSADQEGSVYSAVLVLGVAAGYPGRCEIGDVVVADRVIDADLGVQTADGLLHPGSVGLDAATSWDLVSPRPQALVHRAQNTGLAVHTGTVLTTTRITAENSALNERIRRHHPLAESSTGAGGLIATLGLSEVGFGEIRVIERTAGQVPTGEHAPGVLIRLGAVAQAIFSDLLPR